jgi:ParB family chromosome partitioning protein
MADKPGKARGLGRGLSALMADVAPVTPRPTPDAPRAPEAVLPIERVRPNPNQPRRTFSEDALAELAASIGEKGIIQPLIVRPHPDKAGEFQIVAGERRWRAAQRANLHEVPVIIREFDDTEVLEVAIIENIQRADLNAIDEAAGYKQLMDRFGHTQDALATALGKSRSHIANLMRLLNLPADVQAHLVEGRLTAGHARALIGHERASQMAQQIIREGLSVRQAEALAKKDDAGTSKTRSNVQHARPPKDADTAQIEKELAAQLRMGVTIEHDSGGESGKLTLSYRNLGQLDDLLRLLSGD